MGIIRYTVCAKISVSYLREGVGSSQMYSSAPRLAVPDLPVIWGKDRLQSAGKAVAAGDRVTVG